MAPHLFAALSPACSLRFPIAENAAQRYQCSPGENVSVRFLLRMSVCPTLIAEGQPWALWKYALFRFWYSERTDTLPSRDV